MGRDIKLTYQMIDEMERYIEKGSSYIDASNLCGIHRDTFNRWKNRGMKDFEEGKKGLFYDFFDRLKKAEAKAKARAIWIVNSSEDWRAHAWYLKCRYSDEFGDKAKIEHSGDEEKPIRVKLKWD